MKIRAGFTLLEVNLAVFIMATGILGMCGLYALGFRESRQSVEDVASAAFADAYLGPLVQGLSATNMAWSAWCEIGDAPQGTDELKIVDGLWPQAGWIDYVNPPNDTSASGKKTDIQAFVVKSGARAKADGIFSQVLNKVPAMYKGTNPGIPSGYEYALVVTRRGAVIQLAFRAARRTGDLMTQPPIVTEVRFQGVGEE